jgi:hypothetical protein
MKLGSAGVGSATGDGRRPDAESAGDTDGDRGREQLARAFLAASVRAQHEYTIQQRAELRGLAALAVWHEMARGSSNELDLCLDVQI